MTSSFKESESMISDKTCCLCVGYTDHWNELSKQKVLKRCDKCDKFYAHDKCFIAYGVSVSKCYFCKNELNDRPIMRVYISVIDTNFDDIVFSNVLKHLQPFGTSFGHTTHVVIHRNGDMCCMDDNRRAEIRCKIMNIKEHLK